LPRAPTFAQAFRADGRTLKSQRRWPIFDNRLVDLNREAAPKARDLRDRLQLRFRWWLGHNGSSKFSNRPLPYIQGRAATTNRKNNKAFGPRAKELTMFCWPNANSELIDRKDEDHEDRAGSA